MSEKLLIGCLLAGFAFVACTSTESSYLQDNFENSLQELQRRDYDANNGGYDYFPPTPIYTPAPSYGPPSNTYLPAPVYGPPGYYPPAPHSQSHLNLFEKIKTKLSLYAIGKILLKLLIFKKIVKFIGLIFLLLILPKLKNAMQDDDSSAENTKEVETEQDVLNKNIEDVYKYVTKALSLDFGDDDVENDDDDDVDNKEESSESNNQENDDEDGDNEEEDD